MGNFFFAVPAKPCLRPGTKASPLTVSAAALMEPLTRFHEYRPKRPPSGPPARRTGRAAVISDKGQHLRADACFWTSAI
jgi:hypothetical protein